MNFRWTFWATPVLLIVTTASCAGGPDEACQVENCETLSSGLGFPTNIAVDATSAYWLDTDRVMKVGLGGGTPTTLVRGPSDMASLTVDATSVYWTNLRGGDPESTGMVMKAAK